MLPPSANKRLALEWLLTRQNILPEHVVFSGDSGNDREVLLGPYKATLVANADAGFRQCLLQAAESGCVAGSIVAGIVEGFIHYFPEFADWILQDYHHV